ncbi:uncharacterized protein LOC143358944 [Halictus rubicundus]|uniref:uncharacterized protein LOC143358944 n=1 Tax=Halictus rubicundus TaxID=77578 RepID=UPI00403690BA
MKHVFAAVLMLVMIMSQSVFLTPVNDGVASNPRALADRHAKQQTTTMMPEIVYAPIPSIINPPYIPCPPGQRRHPNGSCRAELKLD